MSELQLPTEYFGSKVLLGFRRFTRFGFNFYPGWAIAIPNEMMSLSDLSKEISAGCSLEQSAPDGQPLYSTAKFPSVCGSVATEPCFGPSIGPHVSSCRSIIKLF